MVVILTHQLPPVPWIMLLRETFLISRDKRGIPGVSSRTISLPFW
jgi:hypothetical protein